MSKTILTVGFELASDATQSSDFSSKLSLLDWDIVLFKPVIYSVVISREEFNGKPWLTDNSSFALKESCEHWRREIKQAVDHGKTVIVFLPAINEVYIATGEQKYEGKRLVKNLIPYTNYAALPIELKPVSARGTSIKLASDAGILAPYWSEMGAFSRYEVILGTSTGTSLTTKIGNKAAGAMIRAVKSTGTLVLLPDIDFDPDNFTRADDRWTTAAKQFAGRMLAAVVALDSALRSSAEVTPPPSWSSEAAFILVSEQTLRSELLEAEHQLENAQRKKDDVVERLKNAGRLRALLYEKVKPLEHAIIEALQLLGFRAHAFKDGNSEFDVVFECTEGRLIGEAEGKDTKPINVDKLRQLAMNLQEDLQREDVNSLAKGVLFGNGFRLSEPSSRELQFTEKCVTAALSSNTALVATVDLFRAVQHVASAADEDYRKRSREAILSGVGLVTFPEVSSS